MSLKNMLIFAAFLLGGFLGLKYIFPLVSPFVFAFIIAIIIEPLVERLSGFLHISKNKSVLLILLLIVLVGGVVVSLLISKLIVELNILVANLPELIKQSDQLTNNTIEWGKRAYSHLPPEAINYVNDNSKTILGEASRIGTNIAHSLLNLLTALPNFLLMTVFTLFLTYFMVRDKRKIKEFILKPLNRRHHGKALAVYREALAVGGKYLRVQLILIILTTIISLVVLLALGVKYAIIFSLAVGAVSIIPAIGTGLVFVPWIVYLLIAGAIPLVWYVIALYLFLVIGRHILEPKLLADTFNISALPMLFAIFVGYKILGLEGILIGILVVIFYQVLVKAEVISEQSEQIECN